MFNSFLQSVSNIIGGEFKDKEIYSFYGSANVGKSTYLVGEVINAIKQGYRVAWVDTEGGFTGIWDRFSKSYKNRFGVSDKEIKDKFNYVKVLTPEELARYFGVDYEINFGKGNKVAIRLKGFLSKPDDTIYELYGRKRGKVLVVIDSFSSPFKLSFSTNVENFSGRADAQSITMMGLMRFMDRTSAITILTHHSSLNPSNPYQVVGGVRGGNTVLYYSKYLIDVEMPRKKALSDYRSLHGVRTPIAKAWTLKEWVKIDDEGYHDSSEDEVMNLG